VPILYLQNVTDQGVGREGVAEVFACPNELIRRLFPKVQFEVLKQILTAAQCVQFPLDIVNAERVSEELYNTTTLTR